MTSALIIPDSGERRPALFSASPNSRPGTTRLGGEGGARQTLLRLVFLPRGEEPVRWWMIVGGAVAEHGVWREGAADLHPEARTIVVVPGEAVVCRWLTLAARTDAQAASAASFLLEEELAQPREQLHIAVSPPRADGTRIAALVDRERMQAWLSTAEAYGLARAPFTPDHLLLPEPEGEAALAVALDGVYAVRAPGLALTCEPELLPLILGDRPYERVDEPTPAERLLVRGAAGPVLDLRQGDFAPGQARAGNARRLAAALGALLLLSVPAVPASKAFRDTLAARRAEREAAALAGEAKPGEPADPAARLSIRLRQARTAGGFPGAAAAVLAAVEGIDGMELQSFVYRDGVFHLTAAHANYSDVEALRAALDGAGLSVEESSAEPAGGRIVSDLVLRPKP